MALLFFSYLCILCNIIACFHRKLSSNLRLKVKSKVFYMATQERTIEANLEDLDANDSDIEVEVRLVTGKVIDI